MTANIDQKIPKSTYNVARDFLARVPQAQLFPIAKGAKFPPCFPNNLELATNDPARLWMWSRKYRGCNWALSNKKAGIIPIDVDTKPGKNGQNTFERLELENGPFPETLTIRTPTGGRHLYYTEANGVAYRSALGKAGFGEDVDVPVYVVIPGCTLDGIGEYTIEVDAPIAPTPAWFGDYLKENEAAEVDQTPEVELDTDAIITRAIGYLMNDAPPSIQGRNGERTTLLVAGTLKDMGVSQDKTIELMAEYYNVEKETRGPGKPYCDPLWSFFDGPIEDRMDKKIRNAWAYLRQNAPGSDTPEAAFASLEPPPPETDAEMAARLKKTEERRKRREQQAVPETLESLLSGWCYVGQQKRFVRKRDGMLWEIDAFNTYFADVEVPDKRDTTPIAKHLTSKPRGHPQAIQKFDTFCFIPGEGENVNGAYNQYVPSAIVAKEGDTTIWDEHMAYLFPDEAQRDRVLNWLAWVLQNLNKKPKHALFIRGEIQGTGKSFIGDVLAALIGEQNRSPIDQGDFETAHNGWQMRTKLITCEEVRSLSAAAARKLHGWITQGRLKINEKNMPQLTIPDVIAYLFFSNKMDALPLDDSDRRYQIEATEAKPKDRAYYVRLYDGLDDPVNLAAIKWQLENRPLGQYTAAGAAIPTEAKTQMIEESATDLQSYMVENADVPPFSYRLATLSEIKEAIPSYARPRWGFSSAVRDVIRRRFNGVQLPTQIEPTGRAGRKLRVWAIGPTPEAVQRTVALANTTGALAAIYRDEHKMAPAKADEAAPDDFAEAAE